MKNLLAMAVFCAALLLAGLSVHAADAVSPSAAPASAAPADAKKASATDVFPEADEMPVPANASVSDTPHSAEITSPAAAAPEMPAAPAPAVEATPTPEAQAPAEAAVPATTPASEVTAPAPAPETAAPAAEEKDAAGEEKATEEKPAVDLPAASAPKAKKPHHAAKKTKAKAKAEHAAAAPFEVAGAYAFATAPAQRTGAAFMALQNTGKTDATLIGAWSSVAEKVELHTTTMENGVMRMRPVDQFVIPAGGTLVMAPHSHHIMLIGLKEPLKVGDKLTIRLRFADGKAVDTLFDIVAPGAGDAGDRPAPPPMEMDHEGMMMPPEHEGMPGHDMPPRDMPPSGMHGPDGHEGMAHCDGMPCCDGMACDDMPEDAMPAEGDLPPERPAE